MPHCYPHCLAVFGKHRDHAMNRALFCLLIAASCQVGAGERLVPDAMSVTTDPGAQELRYQIFHSLADADFVLDARDVPATARVNVYIGQTGSAHRVVQQVRFTVDEGASQLADVSPATAAAMSSHGDRWRILRQTLASGPHVIRAEFAIADPGTSGDTPLVIAVTHRLEKMPGELDLEFRLDDGLINAPAIKVRELVRDDRVPRSLLGVAVNRLALTAFESSRYHSGSDADPAVSHSRTLVHIGDPESALVELLEIARKSGPEASLASDYWLDTVRVLRSLGIVGEAEMICDQLEQRREAKAEVASERLYLAEARNSTGDLVQAERLLQLADAALPELLRPDWRHLYGRVLIAQQHPAEAAAMLGKEDQTIEAFRFMMGSTEVLHAAAYNRYNHAIAMIRSGDVRRGLSWLDLLGRSQSRDPEMLALKDKANLALGWHFLKAKQGRTALGVLGRVRSEGLLSGAALLGMGWAELVPNGERLPRDLLDSNGFKASKQTDLPAAPKSSLIRLRVLEPELNGVVGPASFERDDPPKNRSEGLRRAVKIWSVLLERDERDTSVQEAMLAIAYAYDQLRNVAEARRAYASAISTLGRIDSGIAGESALITDGQLSAAIAQSADDRALFELMDRLHLSPDDATAPLYASLAELRDLGRLQTALGEAATRIAAAGSSAASDDEREGSETELSDRLKQQISQLSVRQAEAVRNIESLAMRNLEARRTVVHNYLRSALLLSARIEDSPTLVSREIDVCENNCREN